MSEQPTREEAIEAMKVLKVYCESCGIGCDGCPLFENIECKGPPLSWQIEGEDDDS